ncbi:hypothetical protein [Tropicimonas sp. IMCC6043]|uniref:hypothetical protein n=1 Tax=Tropicimonas sp. IMCC6043 TaxID=2510645 RepID=UPI00101BBE82|nr:hypothetical protein [Tropicimonas sp. IMCC6043]RYH08766.1 hypothetical protein EU800_14895 [Tropicimonas sp. IMCC6043]
MKRIAMIAGLVALIAMPAAADQTQLARKAGVEPGQYSSSQLTQLLALREEGGSPFKIQRILTNPLGEPLVARLSTTGDVAGDE